MKRVHNIETSRRVLFLLQIHRFLRFQRLNSALSVGSVKVVERATVSLVLRE